MDQPLADLQGELAASPTPTAEFQKLSRRRQREVFFRLPDTLQKSLVAEMDRDQLRAFVRRLDPDEVADVLGWADGATREAVLEQLDRDRREKAAYLLEFSPESAAG